MPPNNTSQDPYLRTTCMISSLVAVSVRDFTRLRAGSIPLPPTCKKCFRVMNSGPLAVMCPAFQCVSHEPLALRDFPQRVGLIQLVVICNSSEAAHFLSIRRVTDRSITFFTLASLRHGRGFSSYSATAA